MTIADAIKQLQSMNPEAELVAALAPGAPEVYKAAARLTFPGWSFDNTVQVVADIEHVSVVLGERVGEKLAFPPQ